MKALEMQQWFRSRFFCKFPENLFAYMAKRKMRYINDGAHCVTYGNSKQVVYISKENNAKAPYIRTRHPHILEMEVLDYNGFYIYQAPRVELRKEFPWPLDAFDWIDDPEAVMTVWEAHKDIPESVAVALATLIESGRREWGEAKLDIHPANAGWIGGTFKIFDFVVP